MTAQDAEDSSTESADGDGTETETTAETDDQSESHHSPDAIEDALDEIASPPDGDVEAALEEMLGEAASHADTDGQASESGDNAEGSAVERRVDPEAVTVSEAFVAELDDTPTETVARAILLLRAERRQLESELAEAREAADEFESRLKRKQADFQNYKKRQKERLEEEKQRATEDLVERLLDVRDNLERALDQDEDADIRSGVESTLDQFDQQLDRENVEQVEPAVGEEPDPTRHEVLATVDSDQPEGTIAHVHRPGYEMAGKVIRSAQVTVSDGSGHEDGD